jgi:hypothetical protein
MKTKNQFKPGTLVRITNENSSFFMKVGVVTTNLVKTNSKYGISVFTLPSGTKKLTEDDVFAFAPSELERI